MSVFISTVKGDIYLQFKRGFVAVKKSKRAFSDIGFDHAHEQNNKSVKPDGGDIGLLDSPIALLKWAVAGPEILRMIGTLQEGNAEDGDTIDHHEDTDNFEKTFRNGAIKFHATFVELENLFEGVHVGRHAGMQVSSQVGRQMRR